MVGDVLRLGANFGTTSNLASEWRIVKMGEIKILVKLGHWLLVICQESRVKSQESNAIVLCFPIYPVPHLTIPLPGEYF